MKRFFKAALLTLLFVNIYTFSDPTEVLQKDMNGDGKSDAWTYTVNGNVERQEFDINFDSVIDSLFFYDENSKVKEEILDTNYDGKMDNWRLYSDGSLVLERIDSNFDGRIDIWIYVDRGRIYKIERDETGDGKPDCVTVY